MNYGSYTLFWCIIFSCRSLRVPFFDYEVIGFTSVNCGSIVSRPVIKYEIQQTASHNLDKAISASGILNSEKQENPSLAKSLPSSLNSVSRIRVSRSVPEVTTEQSSNATDRGASNSISRIRRPFPSPFRGVRLHKFWQPSLLSETVISDEWYGSEAIIEYKPSAWSIQNITKATLKMTVDVDATSSQVPILLYGSFSLLPPHANLNSSASNNVSTGASRLLHTLLPQPADSSQTAELSFQITEFIKEASYTHIQQTLSVKQKVKITFVVRRQCNNIDSSECTSIIDLDSIFPYLRVDYQLTM